MFSLPQLSPIASRRFRLLAALAVAVLALVAIWKLLAVLLPFLLSGLVAYLLLPLVNVVERRTPWGRRRPRLTRMVMAGLLLLLVMLGLLIIVAFGVLRIIDQSAALVERAPDLVSEAQQIYQAVLAEYETRVPPNIREMIDPRLQEVQQALADGLNAALVRLFQILQTGVGLVVSLVTVPIILFYLLSEPDALGRGVRSLLPRSLRDDLCEIARLSGESVGVYLRVQLLLGAMIGVATGLGLWAMGVSAAPILAMLAFFGELVPIVGPTISLAIAAVVTLVTDWTKAPLVIALYLILQALQNILIAPRMQGQALGLHPLAVILALAIFGLFLGFWGVLVAAPFTAAGYRVLSYMVREWDAAAERLEPADDPALDGPSSDALGSAESSDSSGC
ncbi:MAG: AI-2E family transporter [Chloroflexota bacterium]|nr:AI-2E family transporter [Chloroflexota bacterium]MDE2961838.1 AI-2E family transporter [Chloroflexota bacterium]